MNVVALQLDIAWENKRANFKKVRRLMTEASPAPNSLVALPEMFATGFSMNTAAVAEEYGGETEQFLAEIAREFSIHVVAGAVLRGRDGRARNKALIFSPDGKLAGFYAKMRLFTPGGEGAQLAAGERPTAVLLGEATVSPFVCYDLRFPELFRQVAAARQPELYVVVASWPEKRILHWVRLLQARAIENQAYVIGVNRVGADPFYNYKGRSIIVDYNGDILADAGETEGAIQASLDLPSLRKYRTGLPFLEDLKKDRPLPVAS